MNNNLKTVRVLRGMSVAELARRSGLSRTTVYKIENGQSNPLASSIYAISVALEKKPNEIFFKQRVIQE